MAGNEVKIMTTLRQQLLNEHTERHKNWLNDGNHKPDVDPVKLYGPVCTCISCESIRKSAHHMVRYYYGFQPAFCCVVERQFPEQKDMEHDTIAKLYNIWLEGILMGIYCEATKDAEGS